MSSRHFQKTSKHFKKWNFQKTSKKPYTGPKSDIFKKPQKTQFFLGFWDPEASQESLKRPKKAPRGSQRLPEAPRGSRGSQTFPEVPRGSQEVPRGSQRLPGGSRGSQRLPEAPRGSQRLPGAPRGSQRPLDPFVGNTQNSHKGHYKIPAS